MIPVLHAAEMHAADARTIEAGTPSLTLMERAARAALDVLFAHFDTSHVLFLVSGGNNGGDGLAMARLFAARAGAADVYYYGAKASGAPDKAHMSAACATQYKNCPLPVKINTVPDLNGVTAVVDALFGIGLSRPVEGVVPEVIDAVNASGIPVLAIDIPTGVRADTGAVMGRAMRAAHTVTMAAYKYGQLLFPGATLCGTLHVADIGVRVDGGAGYLLERRDLDTLPPRPRAAHKGSFGRVLVVGGSLGMSGAAHLCAKAAYRAGAGLVEILAPEENRIIHQIALPEALITTYEKNNIDPDTVRSAVARADAIAIGMGLSRGAHTAALIALVLENARCPIVLDADALNEIAATPVLRAALCFHDGKKILTPHLGEAARLRATQIPEIARDLPTAAKALADELHATVVLKDAHTVIADGDTLYVNPFGNSGMATGGSGDVLAGVIAAFAASGDGHAAVHGVLAHALAGDAACEKLGSHAMMASDIANALSAVLA